MFKIKIKIYLFLLFEKNDLIDRPRYLYYINSPVLLLIHSKQFFTLKLQTKMKYDREIF